MATAAGGAVSIGPRLRRSPLRFAHLPPNHLFQPPHGVAVLASRIIAIPYSRGHHRCAHNDGARSDTKESAGGEDVMKRSTDRILVTHVGSLVRPTSIRDILWAREHGQRYDEAEYQKTLREEVAGVVRKQADVGIDVVSDGGYGKSGW